MTWRRRDMDAGWWPLVLRVGGPPLGVDHLLSGAAESGP